jgi:hypothetical protein
MFNDFEIEIQSDELEAIFNWYAELQTLPEMSEE